MDGTLQDGLIAYWNFDGDATDSVGTNDGTVTGATLTTGKINQCYSFDGTNDFIATTLPMTNIVTISWWATNDFSLSNESDTSVSNRWNIYSGDDGDGNIRLILRFRNGNAAAHDYKYWSVYTDIPRDTTTFKHYISELPDINSAPVVYIDKVKYTATSDNSYGTLEPFGGALTFGRRDYNGSVYYSEGKIDEVGVWDRTLTTTEIDSLYNYEGDFVLPPSDIKEYSELTQPNIGSVNQLNSIFDMAIDGSGAEIIRSNELFVESNDVYSTDYSGYMLPNSILQETDLTKNVESSGLDNNRSTKWNDNFLDTKDALDKTTSNILETSKQIVDMKGSALSSTNVSMNTDVGGTLTSSLDQTNWSEILPDFDNFIHIQKSNSSLTVVQVAYRDTESQLVIGYYNIVNNTFERKARFPTSSFYFNVMEWAHDLNPSDDAYSWFSRYLYNSVEDKVSIIQYIRSYDNDQPEEDLEFWVKTWVFTSDGDLLTNNDPVRLTTGTNKDDKAPIIHVPTNEVMIYEDGPVTRLADIVQNWGVDDVDNDEQRLIYLTRINTNFSTNTVSSGITTVHNRYAGDDGDIYIDLNYTFHNGILTVGISDESEATDGDENNQMVVYKYDLTTGSGTSVYTSPQLSTTYSRGYAYTYSHLNNIYLSIFNYDGEADDNIDAIFRVYTDGVQVYSYEIDDNDNDPTGGPNLSFIAHPNGVEIGWYVDFDDGTPTLGPVYKYIDIDGNIETVEQMSTAGISAVTNWFEVDGKVYPWTFDGTAFTRIYNSDYTVTHSISEPYSDGDLLYTTNKPFINAQPRSEYDNNEKITNTATNTEGWAIADGSDTSMSVKYTLTGYPLNNFTADNVFVLKEV